MRVLSNIYSEHCPTLFSVYLGESVQGDSNKCILLDLPRDHYDNVLWIHLDSRIFIFLLMAYRWIRCLQIDLMPIEKRTSETKRKKVDRDKSFHTIRRQHSTLRRNVIAL